MTKNELIPLYIGLGTVIGAIIAGFISNVLVREHKISTFRQEWINSLREVFSEFLSKSEIAFIACKEGKNDFQNKIDSLKESINKAKMFLNQNEEPSKSLISRLEEFPEKHLKKAHDFDKYLKEKNYLSSTMQDILKDEWNRVRDGEIIWSINKFLKEKKCPERFLLTKNKVLLATCFFVFTLIIISAIMIKTSIKK